MLLRRRVSTVVLAAVLGAAGALSVPQGATATTSAPLPRAADEATLGGVYVVGDSLTKYAEEELHDLDPDWTIDGVPGRRVDKLPSLVTERVLTHGYPDLLVIALGTNPSDGWGRRDYERVIAGLPQSTRVLMVGPYRDRFRYQQRARKVTLYAQAMRKIAAADSRVGYVPWREAVRMKKVRLRDGVHAVHGSGERYWAGLLDAVVDLPPEST